MSIIVVAMTITCEWISTGLCPPSETESSSPPVSPADPPGRAGSALGRPAGLRRPAQIRSASRAQRRPPGVAGKHTSMCGHVTGDTSGEHPLGVMCSESQFMRRCCVQEPDQNHVTQRCQNFCVRLRQVEAWTRGVLVCVCECVCWSWTQCLCVCVCVCMCVQVASSPAASMLSLDLKPRLNYTVQVRCSGPDEPPGWSGWSAPHHIYLNGRYLHHIHLNGRYLHHIHLNGRYLHHIHLNVRYLHHIHLRTDVHGCTYRSGRLMSVISQVD